MCVLFFGFVLFDSKFFSLFVFVCVNVILFVLMVGV